jgi:hypothetical protein
MELDSFGCLWMIAVRSDTETDTGRDEGRGSNPVAVYETDVTTDEKGDNSEKSCFVVEE